MVSLLFCEYRKVIYHDHNLFKVEIHTEKLPKCLFSRTVFQIGCRGRFCPGLPVNEETTTHFFFFVKKSFYKLIKMMAIESVKVD